MKKIKKFIKCCPLAVCILCSWGILAAVQYLPLAAKATPEDEIGMQEEDWLEKEYWLDSEVGEVADHSTRSGVIAANRVPDLSELALMDGDGAGDAQPGPAGSYGTGQSGTGDSSDTAQSGTYGNASADEADGVAAGDIGADQTPQKIKPEYISYEKKKTDSPWYTDPGKIPQTTAYEYQKVKKDYFDDAVFIGDSRIVGMNDYSGLTNATFFAKTGLTVYNLLDDEFVKDPATGKTVSVSYMMQKYKYGKIYLMVGINELGTGGTERFQETYKEVLKKFRKWQPDAVIYVQSIMGVSPKKDKSDPVFNNTNIRDKNYAISKLTDGIHIFYLNIQEIYEDENHNLAQELTFDNVHLYAQHYDKWVKYLKTHAVVRGE